jgi:hypothetical protein
MPLPFCATHEYTKSLEPISKSLEATSHCHARERGHPETR